MGGRGGSSGLGNGANGTRGLTVDYNGEITNYYFFRGSDGTNYYQREIDGQPEKTPLNMNAAEFKKRVEKSGATAKRITQAEYDKNQKAHMEERRNRPDYELGMGLKNNRQYTRKARMEKLITRSMKRK